MGIMSSLEKIHRRMGEIAGEVEAPKREYEPSFWENYIDATGWHRNLEADDSITVYYPPPCNETIYVTIQ